MIWSFLVFCDAIWLLTNDPMAFMTLMDSVLHPYLWKFVMVFLDDILIYIASKEIHIHHPWLVFELLRAHKLYAKESKCEIFICRSIILGISLPKNWMMVDLAKVEAIVLNYSLSGIMWYARLSSCYFLEKKSNLC